MILRSLLLLSLLSALAVRAADLPGIPEFIDEMVAKHQFKRDELSLAFKRAEYRPDIIDAINSPAILRPWVEYRLNFINPKRIAGGVEFWKKYTKVLARAEKQFGVPQEIILGVIGVETLYGRSSGRFRALDALATLTFDYPRRAEFFRGELEEFLLLAREQQLDILSIQASYAGALGIPQFMPSNYRKLAVDFNDNGKIDLLREPEDAIGSVANFLKFHGWHTGEPIAFRVKLSDGNLVGDTSTPRPVAKWQEAGVLINEQVDTSLPAWLLDFTAEGGKEYWMVFNNFAVITNYNNSNFYAMSVYQLAQAVIEARVNHAN